MHRHKYEDIDHSMRRTKEHVSSKMCSHCVLAWNAIFRRLVLKWAGWAAALNLLNEDRILEWSVRGKDWE